MLYLCFSSQFSLDRQVEQNRYYKVVFYKKKVGNLTYVKEFRQLGAAIV